MLGGVILAIRGTTGTGASATVLGTTLGTIPTGVQVGDMVGTEIIGLIPVRITTVSTVRVAHRITDLVTLRAVISTAVGTMQVITAPDRRPSTRNPAAAVEVIATAVMDAAAAAIAAIRLTEAVTVATITTVITAAPDRRGAMIMDTTAAPAVLRTKVHEAAAPKVAMVAARAAVLRLEAVMAAPRVVLQVEVRAAAAPPVDVDTAVVNWT